MRAGLNVAGPYFDEPTIGRRLDNGTVKHAMAFKSGEGAAARIITQSSGPTEFFGTGEVVILILVGEVRVDD
jgi:hypothetical protein